MTTQNKRARQKQALSRVQARIALWSDYTDPTYDGKPVDPAKKLKIAERELADLAKKGVAPIATEAMSG